MRMQRLGLESLFFNSLGGSRTLASKLFSKVNGFFSFIKCLLLIVQVQYVGYHELGFLEWLDLNFYRSRSHNVCPRNIPHIFISGPYGMECKTTENYRL